MDAFEVKVRQVGTSLGILIPKEAIQEGKIKKNQTIKIGIIKKDLAAIDRAFGSVKNAKPFNRENEDRVF